jgi:hypothetical protein
MISNAMADETCVELGVGVHAGKGPNTRLGIGFTSVMCIKIQ